LLAGVLAVAVVQRLPLWRARLVVPLLAVAGLLAAAVTALARLPAEQAARIASTMGAAVVLGVVLLFIVAGAWRRVNVYDAFIEGAKEGFGVAIQVVPYLIAILAALVSSAPPGAWMRCWAPSAPRWPGRGGIPTSCPRCPWA